jgi:hypothetical protein
VVNHPNRKRTATRAWCKRDGDRYIVFTKFGDDRERLGFVRVFNAATQPGRSLRSWNAVDTTMEHSQNFATRAEAVRWLEALSQAAPR